MNNESRVVSEGTEKERPGKRIEELAMASFLVVTGGLWLLPQAWVPAGAWLACVGLILLGLNAARHLRGWPMSRFGIVAGVAALAAGGGRMMGVEHLFVPLLLILLGMAMVGRTLAGNENSDRPAGA